MLYKQNLYSLPENSSDMLSNSNSVFTCIGLGKRTEKSSRSDQQQQQQQQEVKNLHVDLKTEVVQNTIDCSQPHLPFYHTCHQPGHKMGVCEGNLVLPQATEWDRFESLIQELDRKESDLPPTTFAASTKDIQSTEDKVRFKAILCRLYWISLDWHYTP